MQESSEGLNFQMLYMVSIAFLNFQSSNFLSMRSRSLFKSKLKTPATKKETRINPSESAKVFENKSFSCRFDFELQWHV